MTEEPKHKLSNKQLAAITTGVVVFGTASLYFLLGAINKVTDISTLKKMSDRLQTVPTAMMHKVDLTGLTIRIDVRLKNPTNHGFKMVYPFVNVNYNKKNIGSSNAVNKEISIPPNGEAIITGILLNFPLLGMFSLVGGLIKSLQSGEAVKMLVTVTTTIDPLWTVDPKTKQWKSIADYGIKNLRAIPYENSQEVTLKKAQA